MENVMNYFCNKNGSKKTNSKTERKQYSNGGKQGLGIILSLVATLNNVNIIKHIIFPLTLCMADVTQKSFLMDQIG